MCCLYDCKFLNRSGYIRLLSLKSLLTKPNSFCDNLTKPSKISQFRYVEGSRLCTFWDLIGKITEFDFLVDKLTITSGISNFSGVVVLNWFILESSSIVPLEISTFDVELFKAINVDIDQFHLFYCALLLC